MGGSGPTCGDGKLDAGEECDDGANNGDTKACKSDCTKQACGDGFTGPGEECDDGANNGDTKACKSDCTAQACGDGFVGPGEECDDGASNANTAGCKLDCTNQKCGDGFVGPGEGCDDGNMVDNDTCTNMCKLASCGDGVVQPGEDCDDGNMVDNDACTNACTSPACGDSIVQAGEQCDLGAANANTGACKLDCTNQICGDGFVGPGEACDDGNQVNTDACLNTCVVATCGDGVIHQGVEACDDGNQVNTDACLNTCAVATCGDGVVHGGVEACDDANGVNGDGCNNDCVVSGTPLWTQTFNGPANLDDFASGVAVDPSGNIVVVGTTTVAGQAANSWVRKYSPSGATLWTSTYNNAANLDEQAFGVAVDVGGNIFVVGYETVSATDQDVWVRRYAPDGSVIWTNPFTSPGAAIDQGTAIAVDAAGNPFITGNITIAGNGSDVVVAKLNPSTGEITWQQSFNTGPNLNDVGYGIAVDSNGDAVVAGAAANGSFFDVWVRKYGGAAGATLWTQTYGSAANPDFGLAVAFDSGNNPIVGGGEFGPGQDFNVWVRKYTSSGATTWTQTYNGAANGLDAIAGVDTDGSNNVVAAGQETVAGQGANVWLRKYNSSGATLWTQTYNGASNLEDAANAVAVDASGNIIVAGTETIAGQAANVWVRKYAP